LRRQISKFLSDQSGSTVIEYGLIAAGIALTIIGAVTSVGTAEDQFQLGQHVAEMKSHPFSGGDARITWTTRGISPRRISSGGVSLVAQAKSI
jgi:Flp pilus assembly pilin Flp